MAAAPFGGRWEGWAERRADARSVMCVTVSTPTDAPRGRASTSSGQAPVLSATPGARGGRGPACDRPPGTVRVTPATLAGSLSDGRVERPVARLRRLLVLMPGLPPFGLLEAAKAASSPSGCGKPGAGAGVRPRRRPSHPGPPGALRPTRRWAPALDRPPRRTPHGPTRTPLHPLPPPARSQASRALHATERGQGGMAARQGGRKGDGGEGKAGNCCG
jgi:hypothetical protein